MIFISAYFIVMSITALGTFYKALFGSSIAACRIACSEISFSIHEKEKKLEKSGKGSDMTNFADGVTES